MVLFPDICLKFVEGLEFVRSGDPLVQHGVDRRELKNERLVRGSDYRMPQFFWNDLLNVSVEKNLRTGEIVERGNKVEAKLVPIKGLVSSDSKFLSNLIQAAGDTGKYRAFESEVRGAKRISAANITSFARRFSLTPLRSMQIVQSVIQFKWNSYVRGKFLTTMALDAAMVFFLTFDLIFIRPCGGDSSCYMKPVDYPARYPMLMVRLPTLCLWSYFVKDEVS